MYSLRWLRGGWLLTTVIAMAVAVARGARRERRLVRPQKCPHRAGMGFLAEALALLLLSHSGFLFSVALLPFGLLVVDGVARAWRKRWMRLRLGRGQWRRPRRFGCCSHGADSLLACAASSGQ